MIASILSSNASKCVFERHSNGMRTRFERPSIAFDRPLRYPPYTPCWFDGAVWNSARSNLSIRRASPLYENR